MITDTRLVRRWFGRLLQAWWIDLQFDSNGKVETGTGRRVAEACDDKLTKEMA
jgi:hypothetical protein